MKHIKFISLILFFIFFFTGCWDFEDANNRSIIISVGVDKVGDNVTFIGESTTARTDNKNDSSTSSPNTNFSIFSGVGSNFEAARRNLDSSTSYGLFLGFTRAVIFSRYYAENGITSYINRIDSLYDYRKALIPVICREHLSDLYKVKVENDIGVGFYLENNILKATLNGEYYYINIPDIINKENLKLGYLLPYIVLDNNKINIYGFAVMNHDDKLIATITPHDSDKVSGIVYLLNNHANMLFNISQSSDVNKEYVFSLKKSKKSIWTTYDKGKVIINVDLKCNAVIQYQYLMAPISETLKKELSDKLSGELRRDITNVIKYSQDINCDFIGFAQYFNKDYPEVYKTLNWQSAFKTSDVKVNVSVNFQNGSLTNIEGIE